MGVIRKSITFTEQQNACIKSLIEKGFYTNNSEYIRDVVRKDHESRGHIIELQDALIEGMETVHRSDYWKHLGRSIKRT